MHVHRNHILLLLFVLAVLVPQGICAQSSAVKSLQNQRTQIQNDLNQSSQQLNQNQSEQSEHKEEIQVIDVQLQERLHRIDSLQNDIARLDSLVTVMEITVDKMEKQLQIKKEKYIRSLRLARVYQNMKSPLLFIFSARSLTQMFRRARYSMQYAGYQRALGEEVMHRQTDLLAKKGDLLQIKSELNGKVIRLKVEREALQKEQAMHQSAVVTLQGQEQQLRSDMARKQAALNDLNRQIEAVIAAEMEAARKKAAEEAARKKAAADAARKKAAEEAARKKAEAEAARQKAAAAEAARKKAEAEAEAARKKAEAAAKKSKEQVKAEKEAAKKSEKVDKKVDKAAEAAAKEAARQAKEAKKAEEAAKKAAAEAKKKAESAAKRVDASAPTSTPTPAANAAASGPENSVNRAFESRKGSLPAPITGGYRIGTKFGSYNAQEHVTLDSKGVDYIGSAGAQARAIYDGEVTAVFQTGNTRNILVRHGSYISVYCNLSSVSVSKGQHVSTNTTLGTVAADSNGNYTLHFQLRKESSKLNPEAWVAH